LKDADSDTIVVVRVGKSKAVAWTKPEDIVFDSESPCESLGIPESERLYAGTANGSSWRFRMPLPADIFKALVSPAGGETVDWKEYTKE
jgi:hypothetical protein